MQVVLTIMRNKPLMPLLNREGIDVQEGGFKPCVPKVLFNVIQTSTSPNHVSRDSMSKEIRVNPFSNPGSLGEHLNQLPQVLLAIGVSPYESGKKKLLRLSGILGKVLHYCLNAFTREINIAVSKSFAHIYSKLIKGYIYVLNSNFAQLFGPNAGVSKQGDNGSLSNVFRSHNQASNFTFIKGFFKKWAGFSLSAESIRSAEILKPILKRGNLIGLVRVGIIREIKRGNVLLGIFNRGIEKPQSFLNSVNTASVSRNSNWLKSFEDKKLHKFFHNCVINYLVMWKGVPDYASTPYYTPLRVTTT